MSPEVLALVAMLFVGGVVGVQFEKAMAKQRRAAWRRRNPGKWEKSKHADRLIRPKADALPPNVPDAADQLRTVMKAEFRPQPLLNTGEARVFKELDRLVIELAPPGWQVMAQADAVFSIRIAFQLPLEGLHCATKVNSLAFAPTRAARHCQSAAIGRLREYGTPSWR